MGNENAIDILREDKSKPINLIGLTIPMLRLLSSKAQRRNDFWKPSKPCHGGIYWIVLAEYSHMSAHVPMFQSFF